MWKTITLFELRYQLRQPLFTASALLFFLLGLALASSDVGTAFGDAPGTVLRNAPIVVIRLMPAISLLGLFVITAFVASSALRDFEQRSDMLFFTKPITKLDYLSGRFTGSMVTSFFVLLAALVGFLAANYAPWQPADRIGPVILGGYGFGLLTIILPNLLIMGALFFALAIWSRRLSWTFLCVVFFIGMQDTVEVIAQGLDNRIVGSLIEPSGVIAIESMTRYWTIAEQSTQLPAWGGVLLANRLVWLGFALAMLALSFSRFDFAARQQRSKSAKVGKAAKAGARELSTIDSAGMLAQKTPVQETPAQETPVQETPAQGTLAQANAKVLQEAAIPRTGGGFGTSQTWGQAWRQLLRQTRLEISEVIPTTPFLTLLAVGLMFTAAYSWFVGSQDGTPSYPLTHLMLQAIQLGARVTLTMVLIFYAGQLVFGQRSLKLSQVYDALPVPSWIFLSAKMLALTVVTALFLGASAVSTMASQLVRGFPDLQPGLYLQGLLTIAWPLLLIAVLALFFQVLTNHKLAGLLLTALALLLRFALPRLGFEHNLYLYASHPELKYSGVNGYGHQLEPFVAFMSYWSFAALLLFLATLLLWPRGTGFSFGDRWQIARRRLSRPVLAIALLSIAAMASLGSWIFLHTNVRNEYLDRQLIPDRLAAYEQSYGQYRDLQLPRITSVFAEVDMFPSQRKVAIRGRYQLENSTAQPITVLPLTLSPRWVENVLQVYGGISLRSVSLGGVDLPPHEQLVADERLGFWVFELAQPLAPGAVLDFEFEVQVDHSSFVNKQHNNLIVDNGTFFSNREFLPVLGYSRNNELLNPTERSKRGMPHAEGAADRDHQAASHQNYIEADWIDYEAILSTEGPQVAITAGDLQRQWSEGGRNYFHYKTEAPIVNLLPFLSGDFEVKRQRWQGIDLEVYFHPDHAFNIDRFLEVTEKSLAYMSENFGPYPHKQLRIIEIPNYHDSVAFAFAQTIPFTEMWSFTADLDAGKLDWLTGILAHEVSHQWWNHQVVPANVQGATMIGESLAQYSAMMILEEMYGPEMVRHFLKFHLDRYLQGRGNERVREMPVSLVENQGYIHYSKASLGFYTLQEQVGEAAVNEQLRSFLEATKFQGPPFATTRDLLRHLRLAVPDDRQSLIADLFDTITLFDNRVVDATYRPHGDGFVVEIELSSLKLRDDGQGNSSQLPLDDWIDIGIFGEQAADGRAAGKSAAGKGEETVLLLEKHHLQSSGETFTHRFSFVVDSRPVSAGIDPYNKLIDRDSGDNVRAVSLSPALELE